MVRGRLRHFAIFIQPVQVSILGVSSFFPSFLPSFVDTFFPHPISPCFENNTLKAQGKALVKTDIAIAVPEGHYGRVAPRSGLAHKHFIDVGAGVIDADYRGNVGVILFNHNTTEFVSFKHE